MGGSGDRERRRNGALKRAAQKLFQSCVSFSFSSPHLHSSSTTHPNPHLSILPNNSDNMRKIIKSEFNNDFSPDSLTPSSSSSSKNLCTICLDPLSYSTGTSPSKAIFTAQCSHAFHFACIASNVRHGGITCPICRAQWTHLPRNLHAPAVCSSLFGNQTEDPILQILDDSIATFRVHRRSFLRSARYDDDDPIEPFPNPTLNHSRLIFSLLYEPHSQPSCHSCLDQTTVSPSICHLCGSANRPYLSVKLAHQPATDLVLVASPNGPHLRLMKQSMALVVFSLRPIDRLAIVTYSSCAARVFPLRRMTSHGKRAALQVIERLFYTGHADQIVGLKKGVKVLGDRAHENPESCILHLSDYCPPTTRSNNYHGVFDDMEAAAAPIPIHRFHIGFSFGRASSSNGFVMHEFEEFLGRVLGESIRDIQLRIGEEGRIVRLCEIRGGEERRIPVNMREPSGVGHVSIEYSYVEGWRVDECIRRGQVTVGVLGSGLGDKRSERSDVGVAIPSGGGGVGRRRSSANANANANASGGSWNYHDSFMARRWAKHLHGYRL